MLVERCTRERKREVDIFYDSKWISSMILFGKGIVCFILVLNNFIEEILLFADS